MLVNAKKELVGLFVGSESTSFDFDCGLVTRIEGIREDIRAKVEGEISLPYLKVVRGTHLEVDSVGVGTRKVSSRTWPGSSLC
jgi:hypothetical protein